MLTDQQIKISSKLYKIFPLDFPLRYTVTTDTESAMYPKVSTPLSACNFIHATMNAVRH